jgi:pimeloyl-ACP methyl ester carboxylesterase
MEANVETRTIVLADGRELCVEVGGDLSGTPIVVHGGTPNSRHLFGPSIADARARGATLICYDRPGYGRSTPHKGHSVADGAADVCAIAESLGIERLATWGVSGGGPYALACAALLPDLVVAAAAVASIAPWAAPELDYFDGMGELNVEDIHLYFSDPDAARKKGQQEREQYLAATPEQVASAMSTLLSPVDAAALTGDLANWLVWAMQDGLVPGDEGWWDDGVAHLAPWGFDRRRSGCRSRCGTAARTDSCRCHTESGWASTSPVPRPTSVAKMATSASSGASVRCTPGCWAASNLDPTKEVVVPSGVVKLGVHRNSITPIRCRKLRVRSQQTLDGAVILRPPNRRRGPSMYGDDGGLLSDMAGPVPRRCRGSFWLRRHPVRLGSQTAPSGSV